MYNIDKNPNKNPLNKTLIKPTPYIKLYPEDKNPPPIDNWFLDKSAITANINPYRLPTPIACINKINSFVFFSFINTLYEIPKHITGNAKSINEHSWKLKL